MFETDSILNGEIPNVRIGIGKGDDSDSISRSIAYLKDYDIRIYEDPRQLVYDLRDGVIDGAIRGNMSSSKLLPIVKEVFGVDELERLVILETKDDKPVFMVPVGIDEGWTVESKHDMVVKSIGLMKKLGVGTRIAVMSGGRCEDVGRNEAVDQTIDDALELVKILKSEGYDAYHAQILIESVLEEADLIVAPNGITGNLIFRMLHFVCGAKALGAPALNIDKVYIDTSRVKTDFTDSIVLAMKLTEERK